MFVLPNSLEITNRTRSSQWSLWFELTKTNSISIYIIRCYEIVKNDIVFTKDKIGGSTNTMEAFQ